MIKEKDKDNGSKGVGLLILGGAAGAGLAAVLSARPVKAATSDEKLDYIASLLEQIGKNELDMIAALQGLETLPQDIKVSLGEMSINVSTPWVGRDPEIIFQQAIRNAGIFFSDHMVDFRNSKRMVMKAESSLDQNVILQVIGNISNTPILSVPLGAPFVCPANGNADMGIGTNDDWRPYMGVQITVGVAPTLGMLTLWSAVQD